MGVLPRSAILACPLPNTMLELRTGPAPRGRSPDASASFPRSASVDVDAGAEPCAKRLATLGENGHNSAGESCFDTRRGPAATRYSSGKRTGATRGRDQLCDRGFLSILSGCNTRVCRPNNRLLVRGFDRERIPVSAAGDSSAMARWRETPHDAATPSTSER